MNEIFYNVLPIFVIALLGSVIRRKWLTSDEFWRSLEKLSFYILYPTVLFEHSSKIDLSSSNFFNLIIGLIVANLAICLGLVIYQYRYNFDKVQFTTVFQGATRYNSYIFFAVGAALFGDDGLTILASISPYLLILTNITSITVFCAYLPKNDSLSVSKAIILLVKSITINPFILASLLGFMCSYLKIELNNGMFNTVKTLSDSAFAIGMLIVGASIKIKVSPLYLNQVMYTSLVKLVILPITTYIILTMMSVTGLEKSVGILISCLPCASSSYILSRQLGGDPDTMSSTITFSTIFSILSISLMVCILI
ncbi:MAG: hypothetical protein DGJ47_000276 [Rickettsiaceae bacterium]